MIDQLLSYASAGHFGFDVIQRRLVFADVVGHIAVGVHSQQVGVPSEQDQSAKGENQKSPIKTGRSKVNGTTTGC